MPQDNELHIAVINLRIAMRQHLEDLQPSKEPEDISMKESIYFFHRIMEEATLASGQESSLQEPTMSADVPSELEVFDKLSITADVDEEERQALFLEL